MGIGEGGTYTYFFIFLRTLLCQFVYAIYNNMQQLYSPKLIEPNECEIDSASSNRVLIGDSN